MTFAEKLKKVMEEKALKQVDIVSLAGANKSSVSQWIAGKQVPTKKMQGVLAAALDLEEDYFDDKPQVITMPAQPVSYTDGYVERLNVEDAARAMRCGTKKIVEGLKQGVFPWGYAIVMGHDKNQKPVYDYIINKLKFETIEMVKL